MTQKSYKLNWKSSVIRQKLGKRKYWTQNLCGQHGKALKSKSAMVWEFPPTVPLCAVSPSLKPKLHLDLSKLTDENNSTPDRHVHFPAGLNDERETPPTLPRSQSVMERKKSCDENISRSASVPARFAEFNSILGSFRSFMEHPGSSGGGSSNNTPRDALSDQFAREHLSAEQQQLETVYTPRDANPQASQSSPPKDAAIASPPSPPTPLAVLSFSAPPPPDARRSSVDALVEEMEDTALRSALQSMHSAWSRAEKSFLFGGFEEEEEHAEHKERWAARWMDAVKAKVEEDCRQEEEEEEEEEEEVRQRGGGGGGGGGGQEHGRENAYENENVCARTHAHAHHTHHTHTTHHTHHTHTTHETHAHTPAHKPLPLCPAARPSGSFSGCAGSCSVSCSELGGKPELELELGKGERDARAREEALAQLAMHLGRRQSLDSDFNPVAKLRRELSALHGEVKGVITRTKSEGGGLDPALRAHCVQLERMVGALQSAVGEHRSALAEGGRAGGGLRRGSAEVATLKEIGELLEQERAARGGLEARLATIGECIEAGFARTQSMHAERESQAGKMTPRSLARMVELWVF